VTVSRSDYFFIDFERVSFIAVCVVSTQDRGERTLILNDVDSSASSQSFT